MLVHEILSSPERCAKVVPPRAPPAAALPPGDEGGAAAAAAAAAAPSPFLEAAGADNSERATLAGTRVAVAYEHRTEYGQIIAVLPDSKVRVDFGAVDILNGGDRFQEYDYPNEAITLIADGTAESARDVIDAVNDALNVDEHYEEDDADGGQAEPPLNSVNYDRITDATQSALVQAFVIQMKNHAEQHGRAAQQKTLQTPAGLFTTDMRRAIHEAAGALGLHTNSTGVLPHEKVLTVGTKPITNRTGPMPPPLTAETIDWKTVITKYDIRHMMANWNAMAYSKVRATGSDFISSALRPASCSNSLPP